MRYRSFVLILLLPLLMVPDGADARQEGVRQIIQEGGASDSFWSVVVMDRDGGILEAVEPDRLVRPASVQKLVVTAAYLQELGPEYTFETTLCGVGGQEDTVWRGDLIVRGGGDPSINDDFYSDPLFLFEKWAEALADEGIERIEGDLIADDSRFDDQPWPRGWEWDDLSFYYAMELSALSFNKNVVNLDVFADGPPGSRPEIRWFPFNTDYIDFVNEQLITGPETAYDESYRRLPGTNTILLRSTLPQGYVEEEPLSIHNPSLYFIDTFRRYLDQRGITVEGKLNVNPPEASYRGSDCRFMNRHESVPVSEMIRQVNTESDNFYAEMLAKELAVEAYGTPGTTENGLKAIEEYLLTAGVDTSRVYMRDASGMAPANLIRAADVNRVLVEMTRSEDFEIYRASLAEAGRSGTLEHRFGGSPIRGHFYGKTGYLSGVRSLAGYLQARTGREIVVTIFTNNYTMRTSAMDRLHERILEYLYAVY